MIIKVNINKHYIIVASLFIALFDPPGFAQGATSLGNYREKRWEFCAQAGNTISDRTEYKGDEDNNSVKLKSYCFKNKNIEDYLFKVLESKSPAICFTACFLRDPWGTGAFLVVDDEKSYKEPLSELSYTVLSTPDLYGITTRGKQTIFLYGEPPVYIMPKDSYYSKEFKIRSHEKDLLFAILGGGDCFVFYIDTNTILYIENLPMD